MRILMLNYEFPPLGGGAGNANYYLLKEFAQEKDLQIDLVTSSVGAFKKEEFAENITIHYLDIGKGNKNFHYQTNKDLLIYSFKSYFYSRKLIKQQQYDFIHAWFGIPCGFTAMLFKKPYLVALRGSDVPFYNPRFKLLDKLFFKQLSRLIWKRAQVVVANSQGLKDLALKTNPKQKIEVIYNGVDTNHFKPAKRKKASKALRIICVARLVERKGVKYLLKSLTELKKVDFKLTIIGEGNQKKQLEELAKELKIDKKVSFLGAAPHQELVQHYQQHDIFVLPSLNEGMSNTVLEAMACGLAIIMTDVGGARELVNENGFLVRVKTIADFTISIDAYHNKSLLQRHQKASRSMAEQLSWNLASRRYKGVYHQIS